MTIDVAGQTLSLPLLALLGVVVGLIAGMFGVGGGFLLTPLLAVVFGVPMPIAVGTGLCQMIGTCVVAQLRHRKLGQGEVRFGVLMIGGAVVGVGAGAATVTWLAGMGSVRLWGGEVPTVKLTLYAGYVVLLALCSWLFWRQAAPGGASAAGLDRPRRGPLARLRFGPAVDLPRVSLYGVSAIGIAYVGMLFGYISGLLGIGGGVMLLPVLIYGYGFPIAQAAGTGILALLVTCTVGTVQYAIGGHVHLTMAAVLLVGSTLSAQVGAILTRRLPARTLRRSFALLLWVTIAAIVWDLARLAGAAG